MTKNKKQKRSDKRNKQFKRSLGIAKSKAATHAKLPVDSKGHSSDLLADDSKGSSTSLLADETLDMLKATHADVNPEPVADPEPVRIQASEPESKRSSTSNSNVSPTKHSNVASKQHSNHSSANTLNEPDLSALNLPDDEFMALLTQGTKMAGLAKSVQPPQTPFDPQPVYTTPTYQSALRQT